MILRIFLFFDNIFIPVKSSKMPIQELEMQVNSTAYSGMEIYPIKTVPQKRTPNAILIYAFIFLFIFSPCPCSDSSFADLP